jgi:hypothetical protein
VAEDLDELELAGLISRYLVEKAPYLQITKYFSTYRSKSAVLTDVPGPSEGVPRGCVSSSPGLCTRTPGETEDERRKTKTKTKTKTRPGDARGAKDRRKEPVEIPTQLQTPEFGLAWKAYIAHRIEIKKPMTPRGARMQLKKLAPHGPEVVIAHIENSIANGWQGIFINGSGGSTPEEKLRSELNQILHGGTHEPRTPYYRVTESRQTTLDSLPRADRALGEGSRPLAP